MINVVIQSATAWRIPQPENMYGCQSDGTDGTRQDAHRFKKVIGTENMCVVSHHRKRNLP